VFSIENKPAGSSGSLNPVRLSENEIATYVV